MATFPTTLRSILSADETAEFVPELREHRIRGIGWVLKWAAAIAVLGATIVILLNFGYRLAAERTLEQAAMSGLRVSGLPHATSVSIGDSIRSILGCNLYQAANIRLRIARPPLNGNMSDRFGAGLTISISMPASAALPAWLEMLSPWNESAEITVQATKSTDSFARIAIYPLAAANNSAYSITQPSISSLKRSRSNSSSR